MKSSSAVVTRTRGAHADTPQRPVYSYRYIEKSVRNGELDDLDEYEVKPQKKKGRPAAKKNGVGRGYVTRRGRIA